MTGCSCSVKTDDCILLFSQDWWQDVLPAWLKVKLTGVSCLTKNDKRISLLSWNWTTGDIAVPGHIVCETIEPLIKQNSSFHLSGLTTVHVTTQWTVKKRGVYCRTKHRVRKFHALTSSLRVHCWIVQLSPTIHLHCCTQLHACVEEQILWVEVMMFQFISDSNSLVKTTDDGAKWSCVLSGCHRLQI